MVRYEDFFISSNTVNHISEEEYQQVDILIKAIDSISRTTYQSLYIIDYYKRNFLYVSDNPLFLCGHTPAEVKEQGYMFYLNHVPAEEQLILSEINKAGFVFFHNLSVEERLKYTIYYTFNLINNKKKVLINHKLTPIILDKEGKIWLAACVVSLCPIDTVGNIVIRKKGEIDYWKYSLESHRWKEMEGISLTEKEKDILILSAQGYTMKEVGIILCIALDTVKFYRKRLFDKMAVKNITEALSFATNFNLL